MVGKITWYRAVDVLYVQLSEKPFAYGKDFGDNRHVNFDAEGQPIGIEFVDVSEGIDLSDLPGASLAEPYLSELKSIKIFGNY